MAHPARIRDAVRGAYVHDRLSLKASASKAGVSYHTARRWKIEAARHGDDWDRARAASRMAAGGLGDITARVLEDFALLFQATMDEIKENKEMPPEKKAESMSRLADAYTKTIKAAGAADPKMARLSIAMEVLESLARFIREQFPEDLERFVAILEPFGARVSEEFG